MSILFALLAAACYGVSDFVGGVAARRVNALTVLLLSYPVGAVFMAALIPVYAGPVSLRTVLWSMAGGAAGLTGVSLMYTALARAPMNVISPVTALLTALVPVAVGVLLGERPGVLAWLGIALALAGVVLVSRQPSDHPGGPIGWQPVLMAVVAGCGFGVYFICLARADTDSGIWPVVLSRLTSAVLILPIAAVTRRIVRIPREVIWLGTAGGLLDAGANVAFLVASRHGLLSLASVITALYPAGTVALAMVLLSERTGGWQRVGLGLACVAVVLLTV